MHIQALDRSAFHPWFIWKLRKIADNAGNTHKVGVSVKRETNEHFRAETPALSEWYYELFKKTYYFTLCCPEALNVEDGK